MAAKKVLVLALIGGIALPAVAAAEADFERLWSKATVFRGSDASFIDSVALSGRLQIDLAEVDAREGDLSDTDLRRFRFGLKVKFLDDFTLHAEADYDPNGGNLNYTKLTDAYLGWQHSDAFGVKVGKHSAGFTLDGMTSSKELLTIDRNNLTNNLWFTEEYIPGLSAEGETGKFVYHAGLYSSGAENRGFGDSNGGEFWLATVGYDFGDQLGADAALLRLNLVDNDPDPSNDFTRPLEHVASMNFVYERGPWGFAADLASATGYFGQSDLEGATVMPSFSFNDSLQIVARYTYVASEDPNGVRLARYENQVVGGRGDHYREIYAGLNYYWFGHKLKIQTGLQYATMADTAADGGAYEGWAWTTGFRMSW